MGCCHLACYIKLLFQIPVTKRFTQSTPTDILNSLLWPIGLQNKIIPIQAKYDYHFKDSVILLGSSSRGRFPTSKPHVEEKLFAMAHVEVSSLPLPKHCWNFVGHVWGNYCHHANCSPHASSKLCASGQSQSKNIIPNCLPCLKNQWSNVTQSSSTSVFIICLLSHVRT